MSFAMMESAMRSIILLIIIVTVSSTVESSCILSNLGGNPCEGELRCTQDFDGALGYVRDWSCRRRETYDYDYYRHRSRVRIDDDYTLYIYAEQIDESLSFDPFLVINELSSHIAILSVTNGNMTTIPVAFSSLRHVKTVDVSSNSIESINLGVLSHTNVRVLNISFNIISNLELDENSSSAGVNLVTTIDLSHNAIQAIPNNYFRPFSQLLHLNLSHNLIESVDILTFEGITELETLFISNNKLSTLGVYFARFVNLQTLCLDHNYLTSIEKNNFNSMSKLKKLNISSNLLINIDNSSFDSLIALEILDISTNKINLIPKLWFQHNNNLSFIDVSYNNIIKLEPGAFESNLITDFRIKNNNLTGYLEKNTFQGVNVEALDLSGANISELGPDLFDESNANLKLLNFSRNSISKIHKTTFNKLELLTKLDLSQNKLQNIEFDMTELKNLSHLYINHNAIKKITRNMFKGLIALKAIDLSNNDIDDIEILSFGDSSELESLLLNNNPLLTVIPPQMFNGLTSCTDLVMTHTKISTLQNNAFNGMISLNSLNISHSNLKALEFHVFNGTGSISTLDLSHNQIEIFSTNNSDLKRVGSIDLEYNRLQHIKNDTFSGLTELLVLNLAHNNIVSIENEAFRSLRNLIILRLSDNQGMLFNSSIFSHIISLKLVYLEDVSTVFNFENIANTSIAGLDMSSCNIADINLVQVYQIKTIKRLKLTANKIRSVDRLSFQKLVQLTWIDLSHNLISNIQPGTFSDSESLSVLKLNNNFLSSLQFGVFDGLANLQTLDLSSNILHNFKASLFHSTPHVQELYLDNNLIDNIDLSEFAAANLKKISIGANLIPCDILTEFKKKSSFYFTVTAKEKNYGTENVNGIACKSITKFENTSRIHGNETVLTAALMSTIEEFRETVERILSRNESKIDFESVGFKDVSRSIEHFLDSFKQSEKTNNVFLEKLMDMNNNTNWYLNNIQEYIKERRNISKGLPYDHGDDVRRTINEMLEKQKESLKTEFKSMFDNWKSGRVGVESNHSEPQTASVSGSTDLKSALYFIATCLTALLCLIVLSFIFVYFKCRSKFPHELGLYKSSQPLTNAMEMQ